MFGTLHCSSEGLEAKFIQRPHGSSNLEKSLACDRCRAKKVKCNTAEDGCSRCNRLGKKCTYNSTKQTAGNQRARQASFNIAEQECLLDFFVNTAAHPTLFEDAGNGGSVVSPRPGVDDINEYTTDDTVLRDPSDLDLSNLVNLYQQAAFYSGDNIPSGPLSPSLLSSSILPLPSPPFSPTDEVGQNFQPTDAFHPITGMQFQFTDASSQDCQCLAAVIFAIEGVETSCDPGSRAELDSIVASQKEASKRCRSMLKCTGCISKRENFVLLAFMIEKLVLSSIRIVTLYQNKDQQASHELPNETSNNIANSSAQPLLLPLGPSGTNVGPPGIPGFPSQSTSHPELNYVDPDWRGLLLGDYEISSAVEWEHIMRVLIVLQIWDVAGLVADIRNVCGEALGESQVASLARAEVRLGQLRMEISSF